MELRRRQERLQDAMEQGQGAAIEHRAVDLSTFAAMTAQDALQQGALGEALEALHVQADCEALRAARALELSPHAPATAVALQRHAASNAAALALVPRVLAQAQGAGDAQALEAARRSQADLWAGAAQSGFRALAAAPESRADGEARVARLAAQAMAGYAGAQAPLCEALRAGAGAALDHEPAQLRRLVTLGAGLSALAAQAQDLQHSAGGALLLPENLSAQAVDIELATARSASGPVGRSLLYAIAAAAAGDGQRSGSHLEQAALGAELAARATPATAPLLALFAQELRATAAALKAARRCDLERQTPFLHGDGDLPSLGEPLRGMRHVATPHAKGSAEPTT